MKNLWVTVRLRDFYELINETLITEFTWLSTFAQRTILHRFSVENKENDFYISWNNSNDRRIEILTNFRETTLNQKTNIKNWL